MHDRIFLVTGAPGAGKSTALAALLRLGSPYLAFDIDWLIDSASRLVGRSIATDSSTWPAYNQLWFDALHMIYKNNRAAVFFTPWDQRDVAACGQPEWCNEVNWLVLDCSDTVRAERLARRAGWTAPMIAEANADAAVLRTQLPTRVGTGALSPDDVAAAILRWIAAHE